MSAMTLDPREDFAAWWREFYEIDTTEGRGTLRCKRCRVPVFAVTRHAAEVHGDPIEPMPMRATPEAIARWTAIYGPDIANGVEPQG